MRTIAAIAFALLATTAAAQPPAGGNQRPAMTPEQRAAADAKRQAEQNAPRPIEALDSVWIEELTWMEVRDAIKGGKRRRSSSPAVSSRTARTWRPASTTSC